MTRPRLGSSIFLIAGLLAISGHAADPPVPADPFKGLVRSPFTAELELYSGGITGKSIGSAFQSATSGNYGVRFTFGFLRALNFSLNYMYSNQTRSFTAFTPPLGTLPGGFALLRVRNLNMAWGDGEINLVHLPHATFYLSPGIGFARNGARSMNLITPFGTASSPILPGTAVSFNLGTGVKIFPLKHWGVRLDVRDFVSGGGTGDLSTTLGPPCLMATPPCLIASSPQQINPGQYFGPIPVQNNLVLTLGLIFKLL